MRAVLPDARSDANAVHQALWNLLGKAPSDHHKKRSRVVMPWFFAFLDQQYYKHPQLRQDPEVPHLTALGILTANTDVVASDIGHSVEDGVIAEIHSSQAAAMSLPALELKTATARLLLYLQSLSAVSSPKSLYMNEKFLQFLLSLMVRPEPALCKAASCLYLQL